MKKPQWTNSEIDILKQNYLAKTLKDLLKLLPSRTEWSIKKKALQLRLLKNLPTRNSNGTFQQLLKPFSLDNFDDGWVDSDGRFRVYFPEHPRASETGHILRAIVAYELYHGVTIPKTMCIHHVDDNRLNDSKENLRLMLFGQHTSFHNEPRKVASLIPRKCKQCGEIFTINKWRLKDPKRGKFCNRKCFYAFQRNQRYLTEGGMP